MKLEFQDVVIPFFAMK